MALAYPEGTVFFERSAISNKNPAHYQASNVEHFYSHFMIEYVWNKEADFKKAANAPKGHSHPRSDYSIVRGWFWGSDFGVYHQLPFSYGPNRNDIKRRLQHDLCKDGDTFKGYERGDAAKARFMTMPMPTKKERWVWIDMIANIRAIYIPVAYSAGENYPHLSQWVQVNFTSGVSHGVWRENWFSPIRSDRKLGFKCQPWSTLAIDITGLTQLLSCPRQFRKVNPYSGKFIRTVMRDFVKTVPLSKSYSHEFDFDWVNIVQIHSGINIQYGKATKGSWFEDFFKNALTFGIGFIPIVGPLLSVAFNLAWTAISSPDKFLRELSLWVPAVKITMALKEEIEKSSAELRKVVDERWLNMGSGVTTSYGDASSTIGYLSGTSGDDSSIDVDNLLSDTTTYFEDAEHILEDNPAKGQKFVDAEINTQGVIMTVPAGTDIGEVAPDERADAPDSEEVVADVPADENPEDEV